MNHAIRSYDVILSRNAEGQCIVLTGDEVGNKRLKVLLDIHRDAYVLARNGNDTTEMDRIVDKIINTVCVECVPNGRFIEKTPANEITGQQEGWRELFPPEIKQVIHVSLGGSPPATPSLPSLLQPDATLSGVLQNAAIFAELSRRGDALQRSISESMINFPPPLSRNSLARSLSSDTHVMNQPDPNVIFPDLNLSRSSRNMTASELSPDFNEAASAMAAVFPDRRVAAQQAASRWTSAPNLMNGGTKPPPPSQRPPIPDSSMDVVFSRDGESISSSTHAGNNRFRILVEIQTKSYQQAGRRTLVREQILDEIMQSVSSWNGKFLRETETQYQWIDPQQVRVCLHNIFNIKSLRNAEIDVLKSRRQRKDALRKMTRQHVASQSDSNFNYNPSNDGDEDDMMM